MKCDDHYDLFKLCEFFESDKFKLVYRATVDGFESDSFHKACDYLEGTFTIVKTKEDFIFGGYTDQNWSGNNICKSDLN